MVLTDLSRKLTAAISKLNTRAGGTVDEDAVKGVIREIQAALIGADVNTGVVAAVSCA
jgi:signal recognition particle GTPase